MIHKKINAPGLLSAQMPNKWLDDSSFLLKLFEQIKKNTRHSKKETILILFNNHESYCTLEAILYC
jgi:hypothetical protein